MAPNPFRKHRSHGVRPVGACGKIVKYGPECHNSNILGETSARGRSVLELSQALVLALGQASVVQMLLRWTAQEQDARAEPRQVAWQRLAHTSWVVLVAP